MKQEESKITKKIYVDIQGAVNKPNVYELNDGERVFFLINLAGGLKKNADVSTINRASKLTDGMKILIPFKNSSNNENHTNDSNIQNKVNINTATKETLMSLDGVGEKTAQKIIDYRNKNNGFKDISEIKNVDRIGDKTFSKLKENICV